MSLALTSLLRPYVEVDFTRMTFDSRVTFTRSSSATRFKADGSMETVGSDVPRIDYDPATGEVRGLLVEAQSTNLLLRSQEFDNSAWTAAGSVGTVSANADTAPDGTTTADKIVEAAGAGNQGRRQAIGGLTELTTYRFSFYVKAAGRTRVRFWSFSGGDTVSYIFDLSTVTASRSGSTITAVGNGWYRCEGPVVTIAGQTARTIHIGPQDAGSAQSYTGDGTSGVYVWGAQLELASLASSYIPTTTAAVTRAADNAEILTSDLRLNAATGGVYAEYMLPYASRTGTFGLLVVASSNAPAYCTNSTAPRIHDGSKSVGAGVNAIPFTTVKMASSWGPSGLKIKATGDTLQTTSFDGGMTSDGSPARIGRYNYSTTSQQLNGWIRRLRVWRTELSADAINGMVP